MSDCTSCTHEYTCDWDHAGICGFYRPDLGEIRGQSSEKKNEIQKDAKRKAESLEKHRGL